MKALKSPPRTASKATVLMHSLEYFQDQLTGEEKDHFLRSINRYKDKKIPYRSLLAMMQSLAVRFSQDYIKNQTIFEPFPEELVELCADSQFEWAGEKLFMGKEWKKIRTILRMSDYKKGD